MQMLMMVMLMLMLVVIVQPIRVGHCKCTARIQFVAVVKTLYTNVSTRRRILQSFPLYIRLLSLVILSLNLSTK